MTADDFPQWYAAYVAHVAKVLGDLVPYRIGRRVHSSAIFEFAFASGKTSSSLGYFSPRLRIPGTRENSAARWL
jgi:hypothetical protein